MTRFAWLLPHVLVAAVSAGIAGGCTQSHYLARIATMQRDLATDLAAARQADIKALQTAKDHGDTLTARLQTTEATLTQTALELNYALASKTTGRACLSGDVVRLLNQPAAADRAPGVPAPAASAAAADGAAATDTDVAQWAANARTQYDTCRARLNALIDW